MGNLCSYPGCSAQGVRVGSEEPEAIASDNDTPKESLHLLAADLAPAPAPRSRRSYVPPYCPNRVPTVPGVEHFDPHAVQELLVEGLAILVDLRSVDRTAGLIMGARHVAAHHFMGRAAELAQEWANEPLVIMTCQFSAHRAPTCANLYRQHAAPEQRVAILSGGFRGWEACGLPIGGAVAGHSQRSAADAMAMQLGGQCASFAAQWPPAPKTSPPPMDLPQQTDAYPRLLKGGPGGGDKRLR